ncbi:MAG: hypothetical protein PHO63_04600 [Bacilli bacterium]|nr:hypothetical protein [Bacilli bacterium]MDD4809076.1 hypothetical protein [Bacilli bacterium]
MKKLWLILLILIFVSGCIFKKEESLISDLKIPIQTDNKTDGLYLKADRYVYRGSNPHNYLMIDGQLLRIMAFEKDERIKILGSNINNDDKIPYDSNHSNEWEKTTLYSYLNDVYYQSFSDLVKEKIVSEKWGSGSISFEEYDNILNKDINLLEELENKKTTTSYINLISMNDYISSLLDIECLKNNTGCDKTYIKGEGASWIVNPNTEKMIWIINYKTGLATIDSPSYVNFEIQPVFYLKANTKLKGKGTIKEPFVIK